VPAGAGTSYAQRPFEDPFRQTCAPSSPCPLVAAARRPCGTLWAWPDHRHLRGQRPRILPRYSIAEAAQYVRVPVTTLAMWVRGRAAATVHAEPVILLPSGSRLLSFQNLVEAHVLGSIRRHHGVPLQKSTEGAQVRAEEAGTAAPAHHGAVRDGWHRPLRPRVGQAAQRLTGRPGRDQGGLQASLPACRARYRWPCRTPVSVVCTGDGDEPKSIVVDRGSRSVGRFWPRPVFPPAQWLAPESWRAFAVDRFRLRHHLEQVTMPSAARSQLLPEPWVFFLDRSRWAAAWWPKPCAPRVKP